MHTDLSSPVPHDPDAAAPLLLVVDDDPSVRNLLTRYARACRFRTVGCTDGLQALELLDRQPADVALVDLRMPHLTGIEVLQTIREKDPHCQVVLMSGAGTISEAVDAIKLGAQDFLQKPFNLDVLGRFLSRVRSEVDKRKSMAAPEAPGRESEFCGMIGHSAAMQELFASIRRLAPHVKTAFIAGESGTGKELVARALHQLGPRKAREAVTVNCAGLTEAGGEHELFGHARGDFPGATDVAGALESAHGGVLILDEVCELPVPLQGRLLQVLERSAVSRMGSPESRPFDATVIATTRRDPQTEILTGRFRRELFYRLSTVDIRVPPLRDRKEDIKPLAAAFAREAAARLGRSGAGLTGSAEVFLQHRQWPGNVRELRNTIGHASLLADGEFITERDLHHALNQTQRVR